MEIERMGTMARENLQLAMEAFFDRNENKIAQVYETEKPDTGRNINVWKIL